MGDMAVTVTRQQFFTAVAQLGDMDTLYQAIPASAESPVWIEFYSADYVTLGGPLSLATQAAFGWSNVQVAALFNAAGAIVPVAPPLLNTDRAFTTLIQDIAPSVPGCPQPMILREIRKTAIRVCERTLLWRYAQPTFALAPGAFEYGYDKPVNSDVHVVFDALLNDTPMEKLTIEQALRLYPAWADLFSGQEASIAWATTTQTPINSQQFNIDTFNPDSVVTLPESVVAEGSEPRSICQLTPDKYVVLPLPNNDKIYSLRMFYALKPKRNAEGMDSNVLDELEDAIVHGALQQLLVLPNVAWSDRELASYHAKQFAFMIAERRARANLSNMRAPMLVRFPTFA